MGKRTPQPPPPPDPNVVAAAQTASNVNTAVANSYIQNANQYGPYGQTTFNVNGYQQVGENQVPTFTQTTTLSPEQQHLLDQQEQLGSSLNDVAIQQTGRIGGLLGQPIQAPSGSLQRNLQMGNAPTTFAPSGPVQTSFGQTAQGIQGQVAPAAQGVRYNLGPQDWSADRKRVEDAIYSRLNPQLDRDRDRLGNELVNQGFVRGTDAFNNAMDESNRQANDARMQAILAGGQEQSRLFGLDLAQGNFFNQAQGQDYNQNLSSGQFANQAQSQDFGQQQARGQFANAAQSQQYDQNLGAGQFAQQGTQMNNAAQQAEANFANQSYAQQLQSDLALRNQPINEISALMSGGQVSLPQFQGYQGGQVGMTPIGDYYMQNAQMANQNYQAQLAAQSQQMAGLYGAIGGAAGAGLYGFARSDRRIKTDIKRIGEWINGLPIYLFRFIGEPLLHIGFMAQDVEQLVPAAVVEVNGIKHVNYPLAMRS